MYPANYEVVHPVLVSLNYHVNQTVRPAKRCRIESAVDSHIQPYPTN